MFVSSRPRLREQGTNNQMNFSLRMLTDSHPCPKDQHKAFDIRTACQTITFEPTNENKSCSACPEDQLKPFKFFKISNFLNFKFF